MTEKLFTKKDIAERMEKSVSWVQNKITEGLLVCFENLGRGRGRGMKFRESDIQEFISKLTEKTEPYPDF